MIQAESEISKREEYLQRLMDLPNQVGFLQKDVFCYGLFGCKQNLMCHMASCFLCRNGRRL